MSVQGNTTLQGKDNKEESLATGPTTALLTAYQRVRNKSESICQPLVTEDYGIQTMPDVSPPKWHLAHVSWFFETFLLLPYLEKYQCYHPLFAHLFNSYYETAGTFHPRPQRGHLSRPTVEEIYRYRAYVDEHMYELLDTMPDEHAQDIINRTFIGINHEQQHQELMYTDILHIFASNPLKPVYQANDNLPEAGMEENDWVEFDPGIVEIGYSGDGFCYDNELPAHKYYLQAFKLAKRPVNNAEFLEFIDAGGYNKVEIWLSDAWKHIRQHDWQAPLYWKKIDGDWWHMTLAGLQKVNPLAPVNHISFYEADAFARWHGKRLPTEQEWEHAASDLTINGNLLQTGYLQPVPAQVDETLCQMYGDVWEWTATAYTAYPGYQPLPGTLGEYNGKFMSSQMVLRGGSCFTAYDHIRPTYRNFFYPADRWQCSGLRLADQA